jgi:tRNA threonylcarbamoyladenosine biosynthesis protein TsaE
MKTELVDRKNLKEFAKKIYDNLDGRNILLLHGNLGSGKTTFVREFCEVLNVENQVSSPSFLILNTYIDNKKRKYHHLDFYRVEDELDLDYIGFNDLIENSKDLILIEWPDKFLDMIKKYNHRTINIYFNFIEDNINVREVKIS